jgi:hypothetical protein
MVYFGFDSEAHEWIGPEGDDYQDLADQAYDDSVDYNDLSDSLDESEESDCDDGFIPELRGPTPLLQLLRDGCNIDKFVHEGDPSYFIRITMPLALGAEVDDVFLYASRLLLVHTEVSGFAIPADCYIDFANDLAKHGILSLRFGRRFGHTRNDLSYFIQVIEILISSDLIAAPIAPSWVVEGWNDSVTNDPIVSNPAFFDTYWSGLRNYSSYSSSKASLTKANYSVENAKQVLSEMHKNEQQLQAFILSLDGQINQLTSELKTGHIYGETAIEKASKVDALLSKKRESLADLKDNNKDLFRLGKRICCFENEVERLLGTMKSLINSEYF